MDAFMSYLATQGLLPHGYCLQWSNTLVGLMAASDIGIALSYYSIPLALVTLVRRRRDLHFSGIFLLFSLFIFTCGTSHVLALVNLWWPLYWAEASVKAATAAISLVTAAMMWPLLPRVVKLPSTQQLEELVGRLEREVEERRQAEQRLQELAAELERRVQERTQQLQQEVAERLRLQDADQARQVAEQANRAKSVFLSRMSHEVRTPLNAVLGFAQLMQCSSVTPEPQRITDWAQRIEQAGKHLVRLIDDVMDISRIEAGSATLDIRAVDVEPLVAECQSMVQLQAQAAAVDLQVDVEPGLTACTDGRRLRQVLLNLLMNAVKYNRKGGLVHLTVTRGEPDGLAIEVRDSGLGMTPEQSAQLFQPFNRLGRERGGPEGTGLGLVVVKSLVEQLRGDISVESEAGVGTSVRLRWPDAEPTA